MGKNSQFDPSSFRVYNEIFRVYREFMYANKKTFLSFDKHYVQIIKNFFDFHALIFQLDDIDERLCLKPSDETLLKVKEDLMILLKDRTLVRFERNVDFSLEWESMYIFFDQSNNRILW